MSSLYVRELVEGWLEDPAMTVPYFPTINVEQNPQDDIWMTADFTASLRDTITYCQGQTSEEGEVELMFFGQPGIGYTALIQAIEADMVTLMAQRDPLNKMVLVNRSAPLETSSGSAKAMYGLSIYIDYQYFE